MIPCFQLTLDIYWFLFVCARSLSATTITFCDDHHVLRTRNRSCIAKPHDFMVPASNVVSTTLKKVADHYVIRDKGKRPLGGRGKHFKSVVAL
jgi:hypothetical protein